MEFETLFKVIVSAVALVGIPVGAYAAIAATRAIWIRGEPGKLDPALQEDVHALQARVAELEADRERMTELEERLDFAERLLARPPEVGRLPEA
jgi:Tfp pilus assembly protein PilO